MIWGWFRKSSLPRGVYRPNIFEGPHLVQRWSYHSCSEIIWPSVPVQLQQRFMIEIQQNNALAAALKKIHGSATVRIGAFGAVSHRKNWIIQQSTGYNHYAQ
jgi:hypothetical protein